MAEPQTRDDDRGARWLVGDYRYSAAVIGDQRFAIVRNGDVLERVRRIEPTGNPVIWEANSPMTEEILDILAAE